MVGPNGRPMREAHRLLYVFVLRSRRVEVERRSDIKACRARAPGGARCGAALDAEKKRMVGGGLPRR